MSATHDLAHQNRYFIARRGVSFNWTATTLIVLPFDTEDADASGIFNPANARLTPGQLGPWWIAVSALITFPPAAGIGYLEIYKNGTLYARGTQDNQMNGGTGGSLSWHFNGVIDVTNVADFFEAVITVTCVGGKTMSSDGSRFSGFKIR